MLSCSLHSVLVMRHRRRDLVTGHRLTWSPRASTWRPRPGWRYPAPGESPVSTLTAGLCSLVSRDLAQNDDQLENLINRHKHFTANMGSLSKSIYFQHQNRYRKEVIIYRGAISEHLSKGSQPRCCCILPSFSDSAPLPVLRSGTWPQATSSRPSPTTTSAASGVTGGSWRPLRASGTLP